MLPHAQVDDDGGLGEAGKNWPRPAAPQLNPSTDKLGALERCSPPSTCMGASKRFHKLARVATSCGRAALLSLVLSEAFLGMWPCLTHLSPLFVPLAVFQQLEVDYALAAPHPTYYPTDLKEVPVLRMYGVTEAGNSVAAFVHGFEPYFFVEAPSAVFSPDDCQALAAELNVRHAQHAGRPNTSMAAVLACVDAL